LAEDERVGKGDAGGAEQEFHLLASVGAQSAVKGAEAAHPLAVAVLEEHLRPLLQKAKGGGSPRNTETEYQAFLTKEATGQHKNLRECSGFSSFAFVFLGYHTPLYFILKKYATAPPKFSRSFYSLFGICGICPKKKEGQSGISLPLPDFSPSFALTKRPFVLYNE
jgi:hypothetical protein